MAAVWTFSSRTMKVNRQSTICNHQSPVNYWMHNNMITINGRKMGKSYNNVIKLTELFSGEHPYPRPFTLMTVRFFHPKAITAALDFSNEALQASERLSGVYGRPMCS